LRVGTDCSGIEAPIAALRQLKIPHRHMWSSDIDKYVIQSIKANYEPEILFGDPDGPYPNGDITQRDHSKLPNIDLYVAGFPCQPFSVAGKQEGFNDQRGNVFWSCLDVIETKRPKYFILENVKGILWNDKKSKKDKYGRTWNTILDALGGLKKHGYKVEWKVLNTRDYGVPQNRERVFIIGSRIKTKPFKCPEPVKMDDLKDYIDWEDTKTFDLKSQKRYNYIKGCLKLNPGALVIDLAYSGYGSRASNNYVPCLNTVGALWCIPLERYVNIKELLKLQGFTSNFKQVCSTKQLKKQLGNSMSSNVISAIIKNLV
jgi:DNA (cytosine-5)-methyltransferase 1